jgi:hypothetical protein
MRVFWKRKLVWFCGLCTQSLSTNKQSRKLRDKHNPYRQKLDQISGGRTLILEKTDSIRYQDTQENLCVLMLMIQSANRETKENLKDL